MALERELATYRSRFNELKAGHEGKYVLIHGVEVVGTFTSYKDAIKAGYESFQLEPFLVKLIEVEERPRFVSPLVVHRRGEPSPEAIEAARRFRSLAAKQDEEWPLRFTAAAMGGGILGIGLGESLGSGAAGAIVGALFGLAVVFWRWRRARRLP